MADQSNEPAMGRGLTTVGTGVTVVWLLLIGGFTLAKWSNVVAMAPNEVGDFLAGAFAPLAFFWLILGFLQQGAELRNSGRALWLQGEELRNSVEQQRQLVEVTREQLAFEGDRLRAEALDAHERAQPRLEISLGGSMGGSNGRRQEFSLSNHGRTCTGVVIDFGGARSRVTSDILQSGGRIQFVLEVSDGTPPVYVTVHYVDERLTAGSAHFVIKTDWPDVHINRVMPDALVPAAGSRSDHQ